MKNVEIFKESDFVLDTELSTIKSFCDVVSRFDDDANGIIAFHLNCGTELAEDIVDELNKDLDNPSWYVGADDEEYVYVN